jgi:hypothetical protein
MKSLLYFIVLFACAFLFSCSRKSTGIYKTASFYKINTPGTIAVDEKGNEITPRRDTVREIYIVTKKMNPPTVIAVVLNHHYYTPVISKIDSNKIYVGERLPDNQRVELNADEKFSLWKITAGTAINDLMINTSTNPLPNFYLDVKYKGKNRIHEIKSSTELVPELHY